MGARRSQQHAIAGHAASAHGDPAVDLRGLDPCENLGSDKRQPEADEDSLAPRHSAQFLFGERRING